MTRSKREAVLTKARDDVRGTLERLAELAGNDPYLADARIFLGQAVFSLEKQLLAEFKVDPGRVPGPKGEGKG